MNAHKKPIGTQTVEDVLDEMDAAHATLTGAMALAFAEIEAATKSATNPHFKSKYADLGAVIEAIKPPLIKHGLFFTQRCQPAEDGVSVETMLHHKSGAEMSLGVLYLPANKRDAQGFGSALTYARRYALQTAFGVPTEDDDGNAAVKAATQHFSTGETRPLNGVSEPKVKPKEKDDDWAPTTLKGAIKALVHSLNGCGSLEDFEELMAVPETKQAIEQCERRFPAWWETGEGMPAEFVPLKIIISQTKRGLTELAELESN